MSFHLNSLIPLPMLLLIASFPANKPAIVLTFSFLELIYSLSTEVNNLSKNFPFLFMAVFILPISKRIRRNI